MLLGNYTVLAKNPGRAFGGTTVSGERGSWNKSGPARGLYCPNSVATNENQKNGIPNGYRPPYSWVIAIKDGGMSTYTIINGLGTITNGNLAGGKNATASLTGSGTITTAQMGLIVSAVATLLGSGTLTGEVIGKLDAVATLAGSGSLTGALEAFGNVIASLTGTGTITSALPSALGNIEASIIIGEQGALTPDGLAAAVWNTLAADFDTAGTMGEKLNSAGGGSSPSDIADAVWDEVLSGHTTAGTAGKKLKDDLTQNNFIGLK